MNVHVSADTASLAIAAHYYPVIIIGSGFGGLATAIALKKDGIDNFRILERASEVGGTWRDNSYPGAACDVVSRLYSLSFEQKYPWSGPFAPRDEIFDYIKKVYDKYDIRPHVQFNAEVIAATFEEKTGRWTVTTANGETFITPVLISAVGLFKEPNIPNIPGGEDFKGPIFHSSRWRHDVDFTGKTVAVIGNGASAVQFVPKLVQKVKKLSLFMRTPQYVMPRAAFPGTSEFDQWMGSKPWLRWLARFKTYLLFERFLFRRIWFPHLRLKGEAAFRNILAAKVKDAELRKKLTPDYPIGCKRLLLSELWLDAITQPNAEIVFDGIERITAEGVKTRDGKVHPADAIVFGTGFKTTSHLSPMKITGLNGRDLNRDWAKGAEAYLGISINGYPNFFMLYGPNTNSATSIIFILECQARYIVRCIRALENNRARYMNVREEAQKKFVDEVQEALSKTVPAMANCHTYFKNEYGRLTTNWPNYATDYRLRTQKVRWRDYDFV